MPFTWAVSIAVNAPTLATAWNEYRTQLNLEYAAHTLTRPGCVSGAGWTLLPVSAGGSITDAQIDEIRTVIDYYDDNASHCTTYYADAHTGDHPANKGVEDTHNTDYNGSEDVHYFSPYHSPENGAELTGNLGTYNSGHNDADFGTHHATNNATDRTDNDGSFYTGYDSDHNGTEHASNENINYGSYRPTTYVGVT